MPERLAESISSKAETPFAGMGYAPLGIDWIKQNAKQFNQELMPAFTKVVGKFNKLTKSDDLPHHLINLKHFHDRNKFQIPQMTSIKSHYGTNPGHFFEVLNHARHRMERGSAGETETDYFTFQLVKMPPEAMAAVEMFEITEMLVEGIKDVPLKYEGQLTNALIESVCVIGPENPLFPLIAAPSQANFVIGYDEGFTKEMQNQAMAMLNL